MFRRKLQAVGYHSTQSFNVTKPDDLKTLVVWLENQKICHYKINERDPLRKQSDKAWMATFKKYLTDLECPFNPDSELSSAVDWLLGVAIRYEYSEAADKNDNLSQGLGPSTKSPLDIDPSDKLFVSGVQALAKILLISSHPDVSVLLDACKIVIEEKLTQTAIEKASEKKNSQTKQYNVSPKECGFDTPDPVLGEAAKVLRLLHIQELRFLQTNINELIVAAQNITANPKTDQSLGQVGR